MSQYQDERQNVLDLLSRWIDLNRREGRILEGHLFGSVLRHRDFHQDSDIDLLVIAGNEEPGPDFHAGLKKLSALLGHTIDVTVFREEQVRNFSPLHRYSNLILSVAPHHSGPFGTLPRCRTWFRPDFIAFWFWHELLRSYYTFLKDHPGTLPGEKYFRRKAAQVRLAQERGGIFFDPDDSLDLKADAWEVQDWKDPVKFADWARDHLSRKKSELAGTNAIVPAPIWKDVRFSFRDWTQFNKEMPLQEFADLLVQHGDWLHREISRMISPKVVGP